MSWRSALADNLTAGLLPVPIDQTLPAGFCSRVPSWTDIGTLKCLVPQPKPALTLARTNLLGLSRACPKLFSGNALRRDPSSPSPSRRCAYNPDGRAGPLRLPAAAERPEVLQVVLRSPGGERLDVIDLQPP